MFCVWLDSIARLSACDAGVARRYMFKAFGHAKVSILDGGLPAWEAAGFELDKSPLPATATADKPGTYKCELLPNAIWDMAKVPRVPHHQAA